MRRLTLGSLGVLVVLASPLAAYVPHRILDISNLGRASLWSMIFAALALVIGVVIIGLGEKRDPLGVLTDERNRYSLSRLQVTAWSIVVLSAVIAVFMANDEAGASAGDAIDFAVPEEVWALLGISAAGFVGASIVKRQQGGDDTALTPLASPTDRFADRRGRLAIATEPTLSDLVTGEGELNRELIDIGKLQMLFITTVTLLAYALNLSELLVDVSPTSGGMLAIDALPDVGGGLTVLLLISHAGYLTYKGASA